MGDFLPKCAFFHEIWVENRPKMPYSPLVSRSNPFGEEQQVFAGFIDVEGEDVVEVGGFAAETPAEFFAGHPDTSGCDFGFGMAFAELLKPLSGHFGDV